MSVMVALACIMRNILPILGEDIRYVFVEPFQLIAHREAKILQFL